MKRYIALLCAAVMLLCTTSPFGIEHAHAATFATSTDLEGFNCEVCGLEPAATWQVGADGTHVKACPHGVELPAFAHQPVAGYQYKDSAEHLLVCNVCNMEMGKAGHESADNKYGYVDADQHGLYCMF